MSKWNKFLNQEKARKLSEKFCEDFKLDYCEIYYVDVIHGYPEENIYAQYLYFNPACILMLNDLINPIGLLMHELTHHLECYGYNIDYEKEKHHGTYYQLAKKKVIRWCKENISKTADWSKPLKAKQIEEEMRDFKL